MSVILRVNAHVTSDMALPHFLTITRCLAARLLVAPTHCRSRSFQFVFARIECCTSIKCNNLTSNCIRSCESNPAFMLWVFYEGTRKENAHVGFELPASCHCSSTISRVFLF